MLGLRGKWGQPRSEAVPSLSAVSVDSICRPPSIGISIFLLLACLFFLLSALSAISLGIIGAYALVLALQFNHERSVDSVNDRGAFLFGFLLVLAPLTGAYAVICLSILFLIHAHRYELRPEAGWLGPLLLVYGLWAVATFYFDFDL